MPRTCTTTCAATTPCRICGGEVGVLRSGREPSDHLIDQLRVCRNPLCLSNGGSQGAGAEV